jgi:adenylate cyclase
LQQAFKIGNWIFHTQLGRLEKGKESTKLEPRVCRLLTYLCNNPGIALTRETLLNEVWPGMVVGDEALNNSVNKLRNAFGDDRQNPRIIETLPKIGYHLVAPVSPLDDVKITGDSKTTSIGDIRTYNPWILLLGVSITLLVLATSYWLLSGDSIQPEDFDQVKAGLPQQQAHKTHEKLPKGLSAHRNSVAVLPFENLNKDPDQEYFSDGMTDDLITDLSNISGLSVIARNSVFSYKGRSIKAQQIAEELGATHILEGSIRRVGNRIRINAQFIDAKSGMHIWAERYDRNLDNTFELQDEITERIVTALKIELSDREKSELGKRYTNDIAAYDLFLKGQQEFLKFTREGNSEARDYFKKATELDPQFARAYANYGWTYARDFQDGWTSTPGESLDIALELALIAKSLDANSSRVHWILGQVYLYKRDYDLAIENVKRAIELSPNSPDPKILLARILLFSGDPTRSIAIINEAITINPFYPMQYEMNLGISYFANGDYAKASKALTKAMERNPDAQRVRMWLVATYANVGNLDAARWEYEELLMINPNFSIDNLEHSILFRDTAIRDRLFNGLQIASTQ